MPKTIVAGNWKMNGDRAFARSLCQAMIDGKQNFTDIECVVLPPSILIPEVSGCLLNTSIKWGGQNACFTEKGAFTGEIAMSMLGDYGASYILIGHSERRALFHEDNAMVANKFQMACTCGVQPILCVGETESERNRDQTQSVIKAQLETVIEHCGIGAFEQAVIAYEPVWAIGTGKTATPVQAQTIHRLIREVLARYDSTVSEQITILYGGSMKPSNAAELLAMPDINGGLIGGASLVAGDFIEIAKLAQQTGV